MAETYSGKEVYLEKMRRFCAYQERCQSEVIQKMRDLRIDPGWQDEIIISLIQDQYLSEERYTRAIVRGKFSIKHWGRNKIRQFLQARNINSAMIESSLREIDEEQYLQTLEQLAAKKYQTLDSSADRWQQIKLIYQYLQRKGFESALIDEAISHLEKASGKEQS